jgi:hypothetical protein
MKDEGRKEDLFVDQLLEASLARYRSEEPHPGLVGRILAGVRAKRQKEYRRTWILALASTAAAMTLIVATVIYLAHRPSPPPATVANEPLPFSNDGQKAAPPPNAVQTEVRHSVATLPTVRSRRPSLSVQPRPEQFPTPAPLSEEEKLLLAYVSQAPKSDLSKPIIRDSEIEPLKIPKLKIAMIEIKGLPRAVN